MALKTYKLIRPLSVWDHQHQHRKWLQEEEDRKVQAKRAGVAGDARASRAAETLEDLQQATSECQQLLCRLVKVPGDRAGNFVVTAIPEHLGDKHKVENIHVANDAHALDNLLVQAKRIRQDDGVNAYISVGFFDSTIPKNTRKKDSVIGVLAVVLDFDAKHDPKSLDDRLPVPPHAKVESSPGNFQCWWFFDRPYSPAEIGDTIAELVARAGSDHTQSLEHVFRIPGTLNWPDKRKLARGRDPVPFKTRLVKSPDKDVSISLEQLRAAMAVRWPGDLFRTQREAKAFRPAAAKSGLADDSHSAALEFDWDKRATATFRPLTEKKIVEKLNAVGDDRSKLCASFIWLCKNQGYTPEEIFKELIAHRDCRIVGHYNEHASGFEMSARGDIKRCFTKFAKTSLHGSAEPFRVARNGGDSVTGERIEIQLGPNYLAYAPDLAERALIERRADIFQQGDRLVRPGDPTRTESGTRIYDVHAVWLREQLTKVASFRRLKDHEWIETNCPLDVAQAYLERKGLWKLRMLNGIVTTPTLRKDGTVLDKPGYDQASGLLFNPQGVAFPPIPAEPTFADAQKALETLLKPISTFPFKTKADRSRMLAAMLTAVARRTLPTAPLFAFDAPSPGAGKGLLAKIVSVIATGEVTSVTPQASTEDEMRKNLDAALLEGRAVISIDNCTLPLGGKTLNAMITEQRVAPRILGKSEAPSVPTNLMVLATGNNLRTRADMTRRVLMCTIDPGVEHPESREFANDPVADAIRDRPELVVAALTVLLAYRAAGRPPQAAPIGSFEDWSRTVRDALIWLGEPDPWSQRAEMEEADPEREQLLTLMLAWRQVFNAREVTAGEAAKEAMGGAQQRPTDKQDLYEAMRAVAAPRDGGSGIDSVRLGNYLRRSKDKIVGSMKFTIAGSHAGAARWHLVTTEPAEATEPKAQAQPEDHNEAELVDEPAW